MHMILSYPNGRRMDAVLLASTRDRMRLAVRNRNETIELKFDSGHWRSEDGGMVEIEAVLWNGRTAIPDGCGQAAPKLRTAGG